jgi:sugar lactone lactonase YvrE
MITNREVAMAYKTEVLIDGLYFGEGPRWHDDRLWLSDMQGRRVIKVDMEGNIEEVAVVPKQPSGLGWLPDGRLLIVSMVDRRLLRLEPQGLVAHADLGGLASFHCNDMVVNYNGDAYIGNFGSELDGISEPDPANLVLVKPDGTARVVAQDMRFPNGSVITPDGRTLIVAETWGRVLTAFSIEEDGSLTGRRVWASTGKAWPDGICLDAENAVWIACPVTRKAVRIAEGGNVLQAIDLGRRTIACALGGPDRRTLFIITAGSYVPGEVIASGPTSRVEYIRVDVPGAGLP